MTDTLALRRKIKELQARVATLTQERDIADIDRQCAVTELAHAYQLMHDPADVPTELVHALRSVAPHPYQGVWLTIVGRSLHVLVDGAAHNADLRAEDAVWAWITDHADTPPEHPFVREAMPDSLYGVGWDTGQVAVSSALSGQDVIVAYRALRQRRRHGMARSFMMGLIPSSGAGRGLVAALREAQASTAAATAAATTTATSAITATATSALPAVTAAAISCTAVSCTAPINTHLERLPAHVQLSSPVAIIEPETPRPGRQVRRKTPPAETEQEAIRPPASVSAPDPKPAPSAEKAAEKGAEKPATEKPTTESTVTEPAVTEPGSAPTADPTAPAPLDQPTPSESTAMSARPASPSSPEPTSTGSGQPAADGSLLDGLTAPCTPTAARSLTLT